MLPILMDPPTTKILMDVVITLCTEVIQQLVEDLTFHKLTGNGGGKLTHRYIVSARIILYQSRIDIKTIPKLTIPVNNNKYFIL